MYFINYIIIIFFGAIISLGLLAAKIKKRKTLFLLDRLLCWRFL